jgi:cysteine desulfurase/selenocysteine lyase
MLDTAAIRRQFPILGQSIEGKRLVYLDSAATAHKPTAVIHRMTKFYEEENGNVHRAMHPLSERATIAYENARTTVKKFLNAAKSEEIIFTKSCTEAINLIAHSWGEKNLKKGDVILLSMLEHHSNVIPWMQLAEKIGIEIQWIDIDDHGALKLDQLDEHLASKKVKLVAITAQSNVLGTRPDLKTIIKRAHAAKALVLVDAAQAITHHQIDVRDLDCDFLAFSGHKLYGPTGIGVLYAKKTILEAMPPFLGGGMMIRDVDQHGFTVADVPARFEAGTPPAAEAVGLAAAINWLTTFSWKDIETHEHALITEVINQLSSVQGIKILGSSDPKNISGCVSFVIDGVHPHDLTEVLGREGICLRAGHHCAQPLHRRLGVVASARVSVGIYNALDELSSLRAAINNAAARFR